MASCLGLYVENNLIKYAKVSKDKDTFKVEAFGIRFFDDLNETIKKIVEETQNFMMNPAGKSILFIDEIHRFNKLQQDALLPFVENGTIILIGATTENPYFEVNKALISRSMVIKLEPLTTENIYTILKNALERKEGLRRI